MAARRTQHEQRRREIHRLRAAGLSYARIATLLDANMGTIWRAERRPVAGAAAAP